MNSRLILSIILIILSVILVFLPLNRNTKEQKKPLEEVELLSLYNQGIGVDLAARYVAENNESFQFIDLRSHDEYAAFSIPGAINIPFELLLDTKWQGYFNQKDKTNILYATNSFKSDMATALLNSNGNANNLSLKGGLNEWFALVMNTEFNGNHLSARENAVFENRRKANMLFVEFNNLPDSVKNTFLNAKISEQAKLDGGCE